MLVYMAERRACLVSPVSDFVDRYSDDPMLSAAAMPVMLPVSATIAQLLSASVYPASAPVNSTSASFNPNTIDPIYFNMSSSIILSSANSCSSSVFEKSSRYGYLLYAPLAACSSFSSSFNVNISPNTRAIRQMLITFHLLYLRCLPVYLEMKP